MAISNSSGKNFFSRNDPVHSLESGKTAWSDLDSKSRDILLEQFAPKIKMLALRLKAKLPPSVELGELISSGSLGLLEALQNFNPDLGIRLNSYAENRIRGAMLDDLRRMDWFSRGLRQKIRVLEEVIHRFEQRTGEKPSQSVLQEETGYTLQEIDQALEAMHNQVCVSFDLFQDLHPFSEQVLGENEPYQAAATKDIVDKLTGLVDELTPRERMVLSLYYVEELNMKETARVMDITEGRVSQLHSQALAKLRTNFRKKYGP